MLNVFFTVDVEVWPWGWDQIEKSFPAAFRRYVYGPTSKGDYGLPLKLKILSDHGLVGTFFVESHFATIVGLDPLKEIVGLIKQANQEVQLHLHPEWLIQTKNTRITVKEILREDYFTKKEEKEIFSSGLNNLLAAGVDKVNAFRAGNFKINNNLLEALHEHQITFDSSFNLCYLDRCGSIASGQAYVQPTQIRNVYEYPVSVCKDSYERMRPLQLTANSYWELTSALWQALRSNWHSVVIVSHNFELLDKNQSRPDPIVVRRYEKLCRFLDKHRDKFHTGGFLTHEPTVVEQPKDWIRSGFVHTNHRIIEQASRRLFV